MYFRGLCFQGDLHVPGAGELAEWPYHHLSWVFWGLEEVLGLVTEIASFLIWVVLYYMK